MLQIRNAFWELLVMLFISLSYTEDVMIPPGTVCTVQYMEYLFYDVHVGNFQVALVYAWHNSPGLI